MTRSIKRRAHGLVPRAGLVLMLLSLGACVSAPQYEEGAPLPLPNATDAATPAVQVDVGAQFAQALQLWRNGQIDEAEAAFKQITQEAPAYSGPWTNLGILYAKSNRRNEAVTALLKAVAANPNNKTAYNWLGILYREAGDAIRARVAYEKALAVDPDFALAHYNLGVLYDAHLKRPVAALPHYREYLRLSSDDNLKVLAWVAQIEAAHPDSVVRTPNIEQPTVAEESSP